MVSAICPKCRILLVEADTDLFSNLLLATDTATARAKFVSISWSRAETADESASEPHFDRPGVVIAVATGDHGHDDAVQYPARHATWSRWAARR